MTLRKALVAAHEFESSYGSAVVALLGPVIGLSGAEVGSQFFSNSEKKELEDLAREWTYADVAKNAMEHREGTTNKEALFEQISNNRDLTSFATGLALDMIKNCDCGPSKIRDKLNKAMPQYSQTWRKLDFEIPQPEFVRTTEAFYEFLLKLKGDLDLGPDRF